MESRKPANLLDLRVAIAGRRAIKFWWKTHEVEVEAHALLQAKRSGALVVAGWVGGSWEFYTYADMRDLVITERIFEPRTDVPILVPSGRRA